MIAYRHPQVQSDLDELLQQDVPWHQLQGKTVLVTGATGMLASYVGFTLLALNEKRHLNIQPVFLARSEEKLQQVYGDALAGVHCLEQDVCSPIHYPGTVDYIFHAAGAASAYAILNDPVGIINANVQGTRQVLTLAVSCKTQNITFASTREVYGNVQGKVFIDESDMGTLDPLNPRDCYPESKRLAEAMLMAYYKQYGVPFNSLRIAHTYGPGMQIESDGRVMADLMNDTVNARDIVLNSTGEAERAFCYITDAISGIFRVMLQGEPGKAYNLANEKEPIRIIDLANLLQTLAGHGKSVRVELKSQAGYTNYMRSALNTRRLENLAWQPQVTLSDGLKRTLKAFTFNHE